MGRELVAGGGGGGNFADTIYRRVDGQVVAQPYTQEDREAYVLPAVGIQARFRLTGITETFEMTNNFRKKDSDPETVTKCRLEFEVVKGASNAGKMLEGRRFTQLTTWSLGEKAHMGQLFGALMGRPIEKGESIDPDDFIGVSFVSTTRGQQSDRTKFAGISAEAVIADKTDWSGARHPDAGRQPALVGAGASDGEDPFLEDGDDDL